MGNYPKVLNFNQFFLEPMNREDPQLHYFV